MLKQVVRRAGEVRFRCTQFAFSVKLEEIEKLDDSIIARERTPKQHRSQVPLKKSVSIVLPNDRQERLRRCDQVLALLKQTLPLDVFTRFKSGQGVHKKVHDDDDFKNSLDDVKHGKRSWASCGLTNVIQDFMDSGNFNFLQKPEFVALFTNPNVVNEIKVLQNPELFRHNPNFVGDPEVQHAITRAKTRKSYQLLAFLPFSSYFLLPNQPKRGYFDHQGFQKFLAEVPPEDQLSAMFHFYHLNRDQLLQLPVFVQALPSLGPEGTQQLITNLLLLALRASSFKPMQLFLADLFFGSNSFHDAKLAVSLALLILARLNDRCAYINDLLETFERNFGKERFDFYLQQNLPEVLSAYNYREWAATYRDSLKQYLNRNQQKRIVAVQLTDLDRSGLIERRLGDGRGGIFERTLKSALLKEDVETIQRVLAEEFNLQTEEGGVPKDIVARVNDFLRSMRGSSLIEASAVDHHMRPDRLQDFNELRGGVKTSDPKGLVFTNRNFFSSEQKNDSPQVQSPSGQGFLSYLKKAKQIEKDAPSSKSQFLSPGEIAKIKWALKGDKEATRVVKEKEREQQKDENHVFVRVSDEQKQQQSMDRRKERKDGGRQFAPVREYVASSAVVRPGAEVRAEPVAVAVVEAPKPTIGGEMLKNQELALKAAGEVEDMMVRNASWASRVERLESWYSEMRTTSEQYEKYCVKAAVQWFMGERLEAVFQRLFHTGGKQVKKLDMMVRVESKHGDIQRDFSTYLEQTVFNFDLGEAGYLQLIGAEPFKRRQFKRVLAHIGYFQAEMTDLMVAKICEVCVNQRIPFTLIEFAYLLMKRNVPLTERRFASMVAAADKFKNIETEVTTLVVRAWQHFSNWEVDYETVRAFAGKLIATGQKELYLTLYEGARDAIMQRKPKPNDKQEDKAKFKEQGREALGKFTRAIVGHLLKEGKRDEARQIMNDARINKQKFNETDYLLWLESHINYQEDALKIFEEFGRIFPGKVTKDFVVVLLRMVQLKPIDYKDFFLNLMRDNVLAKKVQVDEELISLAALTYRRTREFSAFTTFLKFLYELKVPITKPQLMLFYKVMNSASDDFSKSQIKGVLELFDGEFKQQRISRKDFKDKKQPEQRRLSLDLDISEQTEAPEEIRSNEDSGKAGRKVLVRNKLSKHSQLQSMIAPTPTSASSQPPN